MDQDAPERDHQSGFETIGFGAYCQQIGFRSQDVIAPSVLMARLIREMSTPQAVPEISRAGS
jgi:hypothetical protein